jgi:hypothetical protein
MSTSKKKTPPPVKLVRRQVPENAIMWVPGTELPDQIQKLIDEKISKHMDEYDQVHADRLKNYRGPAPVELGKIVEGMFYQLSGVYFEHGIEAVGLFLQEFRTKAANRLKNEEGTLELAQKAFDSAYGQRAKLDAILAGTLQIAVPEKRYGFQPGGRINQDMNLKTADHGEAVVSKRSTN